MPIYTIYKIQCGTEVYIGSTRDFTQRKSQHKSNCYNENQKSYTRKIYQVIRENGGWDYKMITPIELFECGTNIEAHIREQHWIREYNATLNMKKAYTTPEETIEYHREYNRQHQGEYVKNNREAWNTYQREYQRARSAKRKADALNQQSNIPDQPVSLLTN